MARDYGYLEFKFETDKAAYRAYRFLALGKELSILPNVEFQLNGKSLIIGWWQPSRRRPKKAKP